MFPKTKDVLEPDFVASVAIGIGLVMSGVLVLFFKNSKVLQGVLAILLIWSLLINFILLCWLRKVAQAGRDELGSKQLTSENEPQKYSLTFR